MMPVKPRYRYDDLPDLSEVIDDTFIMNGIRAPQVRACVLLGIVIDGWTVRRHPDGPVVISHAGVPSISLPADESSLRDGVFRRKVSTIMRHAPPMPVDYAEALAEAIAETVKLSREQRRRFVKAVTSYADPDGEYVDTKSKTKDTKSTPDFTKSGDDFTKPEPVAEPEPEPAPEPAMPTPTVVKEHPARAIKGTNSGGGAQTYESQTTLERTWSDGTVDYPCRWKGCDYVGPSLRSTSNHYRTHERGVEIPDADGVDTEHVPEPRTKARISRLAASIKDAQDATGSTDPLVVAEWIINERIARNDHHDAEPVELTADQILDRIARLVDRGETPRMMAEILELREKVEAVKTERDEARGAISALRDLMPIYDDGDDS